MVDKQRFADGGQEKVCRLCTDSKMKEAGHPLSAVWVTIDRLWYSGGKPPVLYVNV